MGKPRITAETQVLLCAVSASFLTPFIGSAITVALPAIGRHYAMNALSLSWVALSYMIASAVFLVPFGRLADIHGKERFFFAGIVISTIASALCTAAWSGPSLIALRFVQGVGAAMIFATSTALLTSAYPVSQHGRVLGINTASIFIGLSAGPVAGGLLTGAFGWRSVFVPMALIGCLTAVIGSTLLKSRGNTRADATFDHAGALVYALGAAGLIAGFSFVARGSGLLLAAAGALAMGLFVLREAFARRPLLGIKRYAGNVVFVLSNATAFLHYSATSASTFFLSLYLQYIYGYAPKEAGALLMIQPAVMAGISPFTGALSDRIQPRFLASAGLLVTACGLGTAGFLEARSPLIHLVLSLCCIGVGVGLFSSPNTNAVMSAVDRHDYGVASALLGSMRLFGQAASVAFAASVIALHAGSGSISSASYPGFVTAMQLTLRILSAACVLGAVMSLTCGNVVRGAGPTSPFARSPGPPGRRGPDRTPTSQPTWNDRAEFNSASVTKATDRWRERSDDGLGLEPVAPADARKETIASKEFRAGSPGWPAAPWSSPAAGDDDGLTGANDAIRVPVGRGFRAAAG